MSAAQVANDLMPARQGHIVILESEQTLPYLEAVRVAADQHRLALGFFAKSVYEELAREGCLYVAVTTDPQAPRYVGHLLFSCQFPRANVLQLFATLEERRRGVGRHLLNHLKSSLTHDGFVSVYARVAEDLVHSNLFWQRQDFYVQRVEQGGTSRNRKILVRCHELPSRQLFPPSGISNANLLGLPIAAGSEVPLFLLDLNVLFDVMPRRFRHEEAAALFRTERMNVCRLAISDEIRRELDRTSSSGRTDPMLAYTSIFPTFPLDDDDTSRELLERLARIVFPGSVLSAQDRSDLRHLATAVRHGLAGLLTNDSRILHASRAIQQEFRVRVASPGAFKISTEGDGRDEFDIAADTLLESRSVNAEDELKIRTLLASLQISGSAIASLWLAAGDGFIARLAIWRADEPVGFLSWARQPGADQIIARIAVDERANEAGSAARLLLLYLFKQMVPRAPVQICLEVPQQQSILREVAAKLGFNAAGQGQLTKLVLGRVVLPGTWDAVATDLATKSGIKLVGAMPQFRSSDQQIPIVTPNGNRVHVGLDSLETLLGPTLFCLPGRPAVITPVQRRYSEALLGHSPQRSFLPQGSASTFQERHYVSNPRTLDFFQKGALILFYESGKNGGSRALVAVARVREAYLEPLAELRKKLQQSVLTEETLEDIGSSEMRTVTAFDSVFHLPREIPLARLEQLGCGRPNDLISTKGISDNQLQAILTEAFNG